MIARPVPVLMYHRISASASRAMRKFTVSPDDFKAQLAWLREQGYVGLTVSDFARCVRTDAALGGGADSLPARPVVLTFDDGFTDFAEHAAPALRRHGFPATLYVVAGQLGGTSTWLEGADARLPLLDGPALARLQQQGIEIGAHGLSHRALDGLPDADLQQEVAAPRALLAGHLGVAPDSFCFPFGFRNERVRQAVRQAGYRSACAVRYGTSSPRDDLFDLARHIVPGGMRLSAFAALVGGRPPLLAWVRDRLRTQAGFLARQALGAFHR